MGKFNQAGDKFFKINKRGCAFITQFSRLPCKKRAGTQTEKKSVDETQQSADKHGEKLQLLR